MAAYLDQDALNGLSQAIRDGKLFPSLKTDLRGSIQIPEPVEAEPGKAMKILLEQLARQTEAQEQQAAELHRQAEAQEQQAAELHRQAETQEQQAAELHRQAEAQERINKQLKKEAADRAHDDKRYFWLGALVSLITALLVEHGAALLSLLQQGYLLLTQAS